MKKFLFLFSAILLMASCTANKNTVASNEPAPPPAESVQETRTIKGEVMEIQRGKDGYTAIMTSTTYEIYFVTISRVNLKNPEQYRAVKVGDKIKVTGEFWTAEDGNHITARELQ